MYEQPKFSNFVSAAVIILSRSRLLLVLVCVSVEKEIAALCRQAAQARRFTDTHTDRTDGAPFALSLVLSGVAQRNNHVSTAKRALPATYRYCRESVIAARMGGYVGRSHAVSVIANCGAGVARPCACRHRLSQPRCSAGPRKHGSWVKPKVMTKNKRRERHGESRAQKTQVSVTTARQACRAESRLQIRTVATLEQIGKFFAKFRCLVAVPA